MKLVATIYNGLPVNGSDRFSCVFRRRIYDNNTEKIDSIDTYLDDGNLYYGYKGDEIIENMNRNTHVIEESIWKEYCKKLSEYLTKNEII